MEWKRWKPQVAVGAGGLLVGVVCVWFITNELYASAWVLCMMGAMTGMFINEDFCIDIINEDSAKWIARERREWEDT
jgi:hypothetical protein